MTRIDTLQEQVEGRARLLIARRKAFSLAKRHRQAKRDHSASTGLYRKWVRANAEVIALEARNDA